MRVGRLGAAFIIAWSLFGHARLAVASAFLLPAGSGEVLTTALFSGTTRAFDGAGHLIPVPAYNKFELSSYIDYGITDWLSVIANPSLDHVHAGGEQPASFTGLGKGGFGAALQVYRTETISIAVQTLAETPSVAAHTYVAPAFIGDHSWDGDFRLMIGNGFTVAGLPAYSDVEAGYRVRGGGWANELRLDVTVGVRPAPPLLLMVQSFAAYATAAGPLWPRDTWWKLQGSVVYDFSRAWSVQLGLFGTVAGLNAGREFGPLVGLWYRF